MVAFISHFRAGFWVLMAKTKADGRRREKTERASQESVKFLNQFVYPQFYRSMGPRGVPWGSGERSEGVAISANQHSTRKCEINETAADGRCRKKTGMASQDSVKFRILFVISQFYCSTGCRETFWRESINAKLSMF